MSPLIVKNLFYISSLLFLFNSLAWVLMLLRDISVAKWLFNLLSEITGGTIALFGLLAGLLGIVSLVIWFFALILGRSKDIEIKYVFPPILYGVIWIILVFGKMSTGVV